MAAPVVVAGYTFALLWLVLKHRLVASGFAGLDPPFRWRLLPAVASIVAVVVVPYVPSSELAWCPDVTYGAASAPALVIACGAPLFHDARVVPDAVAWVALLLMCLHSARAGCVDVASVLGGVLAVLLLRRISHRPTPTKAPP